MCIRKILLVLIAIFVLMAFSACGDTQDTDSNISTDNNIDTNTDTGIDTDTSVSTDTDIGTDTDISTDTDIDTDTDAIEKIEIYDNFSTVLNTIPSADRLKQMNLSALDYNTGSLYTEEQLEKAKAQANLITFLTIPYPNASKAMKHFLKGTGENYELDVGKLLKNSIAKENMLSDVNKALRAVEVLSTENDSITVYQVEESLHHNLVEDWKFALGSYFTSIELYNVEQKSLLGVTYYTAKMKYIVQDFYNWDKNDTNDVSILKVSPADLHQLHVNGEAQEFLTYGEIEYEIKWVKGVDASEIKCLND